MKLKCEDRVNVKSLFISGAGTIVDISDNSIYPIQVEMDVADETGHKLFRFSPAEVKPLEGEELHQEEEKPENEAPEASEEVLEDVEEETPEKPPVHMLIEMVEEIKGYSFKVGDVFAASETGSGYNTCYYLFNPVTFEARGCMVKEAFKLLYSNLSASEITSKAQIRQTVRKAVEKPLAITVESLKEAEKRDKELQEQAKKAQKKPKLKKVTYRELEEAGQTSIFDFL